MSTFREMLTNEAIKTPKGVDPLKYAGKNIEVFWPVERGINSGYVDANTSKIIQMWTEFEGSKSAGQMDKKYFKEVFLNAKDAKIARGL